MPTKDNRNPLDAISDEVSRSDNPALLDSDLTAASELAKEKLSESTGVAGENLTAKVIARLTKEAKASQPLTGNTSVAQAESHSKSNPFMPDIRVTKNKAGFSTRDAIDQFNPDVQVTPPISSADQNSARSRAEVARPATQVDLASIDESNVLDMPFIDAHSFDIPAMLQVKPKDPGTRFRWVNYKNYEGGNYAMFKAIGFSNAMPADVDGPISEHLIKSEDGTIRWFDVMLMKVSVIQLMGVYKKNIIRALQMVGRWQPQAISQAKRTLENEVGSDVLQMLKDKGLTVEFYAPSQKEMADQDKAFAEGR
jgi:hypothetical protein